MKADYDMDSLEAVAPFAGAWIEIVVLYKDGGLDYGRSLRGSVD